MQAATTKWDKNMTLQARALFEKAVDAPNVASLAEYYLGYADYRLSIFFGRAENDKDQAVEYLQDAVKHLEKAKKLDRDFADAYALLSSCYGQIIGYKPETAMQNGILSGQMMGIALNLAPENPRVVLLDAIGKYYTPSAFGGSKEKALAGFKTAKKLFATWKPKNNLQPDWGNEEVYAWLGIAYRDRDEPIMARKAFQQALAVNPEYSWVKDALLPSLAAGKKQQP